MIRFVIKNINNFDYNERERLYRYAQLYKLNSIKCTYKYNVKNPIKIGIL